MLSALVATSPSEPLHQTLHPSCFSRYKRLRETTLQILADIKYYLILHTLKPDVLMQEQPCRQGNLKIVKLNLKKSLG